jgi:hypothetical protein
LAISCGGLTFYFSVQRYLKSDAFRDLAARKTSQFLHAEGQYLPFHWAGRVVSSDGFHGRGSSDSFLRDARANKLQAAFEPSGILDGVWLISELNIQEMSLAMGLPSERTLPSDSKFPAQEPSSPVWVFGALLPKRLEVKRIVIEHADFVWGPSSKPAGSVRGVGVVAGPLKDGVWNVTGQGGVFHQSDWPELKIEKIQMNCSRSGVLITDGQCWMSDTGKVNVTGKIEDLPRPQLDVSVRYENVPALELLPEDWRARLKGYLTGAMQVKGALKSPDSITATGMLQLVSGRLEALPVLNRIALFTGSERFRQIAITTGEASFSWSKDTIVVPQLVMESAGLLRIEGKFQVVKEIMDGAFVVGVKPEFVRFVPGASEKVFTEERDGYVWAPMKVTGPVDDLSEDLSAQLLSAAGKELLEDAKSLFEKGKKGLLDLLAPRE